MSLRVQGPDGCVHVQPIPLIAVALRPAGNTSVTVTAPEVDPVPELPTVRIYVATVWPCVKLPLCVLLIVRLGAPVTGKSQMPELPPPAGFCTITWAVPATAMSAVLMAACSCVPLTFVVVRLVPFQYTTEPLTNPFPFTVRVKAPVPAVADEGASEVIEGVRLSPWLMVKAILPEVPPPGAGLNTITWAVPATAMSAVLMAACSCVPLTYVVVRLVPFQYTTEPFINPFPFTVRVKAPVPAVADEGDNEVSDGAGLGGALMVKPVLAEVPPPGDGLNTITWAVPAAAMSAALMDACSCPPLTYVVDRFAPFQFTTDPLTKPLPFTVRVKAAVPAVADEGDSEAIDGVGLLGALMVNPALPEVPPPGDGLNTVTWAVPAAAMSAALMDACSCPPLTYVVDRFAPFQFTTDPLTKPLPFTVRVKAAVPAVADEGDSEAIDGVGLLGALMVNPALPEVPPPGDGLNTVTWAVPAAAMSAALMDAWSCPPLTYVVDRFAPFQFTTDPLTKPLPFTVRVKAAVPAVADEGDSEAIDGVGLLGALMVKPALPEVPPPGDGLNTVTWAVPAAAMSAALMDACSCPPLTYVVDRFAPFQFTTDPLTKPLPFTVRVKAAVPAVADEGDSEAIDGVGLLGALMVKPALPEVPPPGDGLNTVTWAVPAAAMSAALMDACSCPPLTYVVDRFAPFQFTTDPLTKPLPFTVRVKAAVPAVADEGDSEAIDGVGLLGALMVNPALPEVPPPGDGLNTVTWAVPAAAMSAALMDACSCPPLTYVVD